MSASGKIVWRRRWTLALRGALASLALTGCTFSVDPGTSSPDSPSTNANPSANPNSNAIASTPKTNADSPDGAPSADVPPQDSSAQTPKTDSQKPESTGGKEPVAPSAGAEKKAKPLLQIESTSRTAVDRASGIEVITFDDLNLGMQADMVFRDFLLNDRVRELDGKKIRLIGVMDGGVSQTKGIKEFVLLKNAECKFGPGGQADHLVRVLMKGDATADFSLNSLQIEGTLKVNPFNGPDGNTWSVYDVVGESVKTIRSR